MKNHRSVFASLAAVALMAATLCAPAQAQTITYQVQITPAKTVDIFRAKIVNNTPGVNSVTDQNGLTTAGTFRYPTSVTASEFFQGAFAASPVGSQVYYNLTQTSSVECVGSQSVVNWLTGPALYINDGCAFSDNVKARSR